MTDEIPKTLAEEIGELEKWAELGRGVVALADELGLLPEEEQPKPRKRRKRRGVVESEQPTGNVGQEA